MISVARAQIGRGYAHALTDADIAKAHEMRR
jgi:hypothetical protein